MAEYEMEPFSEVMMLGRWPVTLPAYRVEHCRVSPNWEEGRLLSMHAHLKPGDVLYDVGAEHGDLSVLYATWVTEEAVTVGPPIAAGIRRDESIPSTNDYIVFAEAMVASVQRGGVVLVEGSDKFWPVIKATFEANGLTPIACYAGFASDIDSPESERGPGWSHPTITHPVVNGAWPSWADGEPVAHHGFKSLVESKQTIPNVRFDTLDDWIAKVAGGPNPTALTIDVEGAELLVLRGSERILSEHRPLVWVSVHPTLIAHDYPESGVLGSGDPDHERARVLGYLTQLGYRYQHLESNHEEHFVAWPEERTDFDPWLDVEHLRDGVHP